MQTLEIHFLSFLVYQSGQVDGNLPSQHDHIKHGVTDTLMAVTCNKDITNIQSLK